MKRYNESKFFDPHTQLTEIPKSILKCLIEKKELSKYEITKATKHAYSGIYKAVKLLLKYELIEVSRKEKNQRNPNIEVEYYRITLLGIVDFLIASTRELFRYALANESPSHSLIDGSDKKWRGILLSLLRDYSYVFPKEFQNFSKEFALALCADYCFVHAYYGEDPAKWGFVEAVLDGLDQKLAETGYRMIIGIPLVKEYMYMTFLDLIEAKTNKKAPLHEPGPRGEFLLYPGNEKYIKRLSQLMRKKDLEILVDMAERMILVKIRNYEEIFEALKELLTFLKDVKSGLQGS